MNWFAVWTHLGVARVRGARGQEHDSLAQPGRGFDEDRAEDDCEAYQADEALHLQSLVVGLHLAKALWQPHEIAPVDGVESDSEAEDSEPPRGQTARGHPPEGHAFQVAQEQRRIADGGEAAADVPYEEDEEDRVVIREPVAVHANPRADEQHRGAGRAHDVCEHRPGQQEEAVRPRRGLSLYSDVDAARYHKERTDEDDEARVVARDAEHPPPRAEREDVIENGDRGQRRDELFVMRLPEVRAGQRHDGDARQQRPERENHPRTGIDRRARGQNLTARRTAVK